MINRTVLGEKIESAGKTARKYKLPVLESDFETLKRLNEEYKVSVLFIGSFSAGKSALLNCMIGEGKLVENQAPETAIATEIVLGEKESVHAVRNDGKTVFDIDVMNINVDEYSHLVYKQSSPTLKELTDYILVDTPGFDSGIARHNKALMQYVGKNGTAYILVVDCEKGTLSQSALNYLNEVSNYSPDIAVVINKCEKKTKEDVDKIKEHIRKLIAVNCGNECPVITTSKYDKEAAVKLSALIKGFDPQELYEKEIGELIDGKIGELVKSLKAIEKNKELDISDIEIEIERREAAKNKILQELNKQKTQAKKKLHNEVKEEIIENIQTKLMNNTRALADAYKVGIERFQERVVSIVRPVIIKSVENYEMTAYEDIIKSISVDNLDFGIDGEEIGRILNEILTRIDKLSPILKQNAEETDGNGSYRTITSFLAIATDVIAPPIEILIVFLPDIINLVKSLIGSDQDHKLMEAIRTRVIPEIVDKLSAELDSSLNNVEAVLIENIESSVSKILDVEINALEQAEKQKKAKESDFEKYILDLKSDIALYE